MQLQQEVASEHRMGSAVRLADMGLQVHGSRGLASSIWKFPGVAEGASFTFTPSAMRVYLGELEPHSTDAKPYGLGDTMTGWQPT